MIAMICR